MMTILAAVALAVAATKIKITKRKSREFCLKNIAHFRKISQDP
jgi:hypothetical protein